MVLRTALAQVRGMDFKDVVCRPISAWEAKRAAKKFLDWFDEEAPVDAERFYVTNSDDLMRYRDASGMHNAIDFVIRLAMERFDEANAQRVIDAARALLV